MARGKGSRGRSSSKSSKGGSYRSAISGRYVTAAHGRRSPKTTVRESSGKGGSSGGSNRSAITGRFISNAAAARHPNTSVREGS